ncbi:MULTISPECIES: hypothetical protein [unclassified Pseudoxanthomonas]|uniref:hypothetical protein n=1 Tax=unclassified Pseudoxanthomonas TaxID=2645906 RepID=UPI00307F85AB
MDWTIDSGIAALLGALVGGITSWLATWSIEARRDRRQAKSLALAAASEIDAVLAIVNARKWRDGFVEALEEAEQGNVQRVTVHVRQDYFPLTRAAMAHAGVINRDLSVLLARFVILADGVTADLRRIAENDIGTDGSLFDDAEGAKVAYAELIEITDAAFHVGREAVTLVSHMYPRNLLGYLSRIKRSWNVLVSGAA